MIERTKIWGYVVIFLGIGLLVFTFLNAYLFLAEPLNILSTSLVDAFGEVLGPLIEACIRILYLGIMGWIGSIITLRGIQILTHISQKINNKKETSQQETKISPKGNRKKN